jgi:ATP-dependent helicase/nuclease subunit B
VFWRRIRSHSQLLAMDEDAMARSVATAFEEAKAVLPPARWAALPSAIAAVEGPCVCRLVGQWLHEFERERPPFTVVETERRATVTLAGYTLDLRIDRIDALASGGVAVIDYKSGYAIGPSRWFEPRPQGMQVALYARACEQAAPETPVRAVVYAQLRPGEMKPVGVGAETLDWPALTKPVDIKGAGIVDWEDARDRQRANVERLAAEFGEGGAAIVPRDRRKVCTLCGLHAVCRIGTPFDDAPPSDAEGYDDD